MSASKCFFFVIFVYLRGNLQVRLAIQHKSLEATCDYLQVRLIRAKSGKSKNVIYFKLHSKSFDYRYKLYGLANWSTSYQLECLTMLR